jgi:outer membrane protein assembly factor BamD (BamD/ComL family)
MSITGIASNILSSLYGAQSPQNQFQQVQNEFQQLGQALQSGNLSQAQSDFATLSQNVPGLGGSTASASTAAASTTPTTNAANTNPIAQAFAQLGQDLQSGNLTAAQQDYATIQQDVQQNAGQQVGGHHHHHHHGGSSQNSSSTSSSSSQANPIDQAFSQLAQTLQSGNLSGAQSAFAALQNDLEQIGGFVTSGGSSTAAATASSGLNVVA